MKSSLKGLIKRTGLRREHVASARMYVERNVLATLPRPTARPGGRILCYHSFGQQSLLGTNDVAPDRFRRQIELALNEGYRFAPPAEIARTGGGPKDLAITFDDGWKSVLGVAAPILKAYGVPSTLFVVSGWCDDCPPHLKGEVLSWRELEALPAYGVEIGSHSVSHPNFGAIDVERAQRELEQSRDSIRRNLGFEPKTFAIPFGQSNNWTPAAMRLARAAGYEIIYAQAERTRPEGTVARTFVTQFDNDRLFRGVLAGAFDNWEEWV